jgi:hypothetical protein
MNLVIWLPATFVLGLAAMGICLAFVSACEVIWRRHYNDRSDNPGDGRRARLSLHRARPTRVVLTRNLHR